jgi:two-component system cell cycle response regulator DivK
MSRVSDAVSRGATGIKLSTQIMSDQTFHSTTARANRPVAHGRAASAAPLTIMVVEDSEDVRLMMRILLEMEGYRVIEAADGMQAVEMAINERPALIMMDLTLPLLDGLAATNRIRQHLSDVPVVALSGHVTDNYRSAAFAAGCTDYLVKPLDFNHLHDILNSLS